ncbi:alpha/beta hydrolase [Herbaspirillum sp. LeCh32-8]|uniref:alpha/beta fold hydrolase n=1 Tax=Herbaspirillum sp. LeCh32-8 TaxID=2821356 RepID=UPI001AEA1050|nr:alpha/beta hydrolase [Herbaspirillum sp. LeCh32-8]MBP0598861.1 alpha/beta hydrolase [Herbaspirillum sp. LeCh32-8]
MTEESFEFEGVPVTYYRVGSGAPLLMLHGSGPGASSLGNWRTVMGPLSERFEIFAMDLIGFGKSGRKPAAPYFDYDMWVRQAQAMLARINGKRVGIIGHSLSGSIALKLASMEDRVAAVLTTGTMGGTFTINELTRRVWTGPRNREDLVQTLSGIIFDTSVIDEAYLAAREPVVFAPGYADYFDSMFQGEKQQYADAAKLDATTLEHVHCAVRLLHGREDLAFPISCSYEIAKALPQADVLTLSKCSHSVAFERTSTFLAQVNEFMGTHLN